MLLFGVNKKWPDVNNHVLSIARRAIFLRRNLALYEGRICDLWVFFATHFKAFFNVYYSFGFEFFENAFMGGNTLFSGDKEGGLIFHW